MPRRPAGRTKGRRIAAPSLPAARRCREVCGAKWPWHGLPPGFNGHRTFALPARGPTFLGAGRAPRRGPSGGALGEPRAAHGHSRHTRAVSIGPPPWSAMWQLEGARRRTAATGHRGLRCGTRERTCARLAPDGRALPASLDSFLSPFQRQRRAVRSSDTGVACTPCGEAPPAGWGTFPVA